jgi:hypothetical protein
MQLTKSETDLHDAQEYIRKHHLNPAPDESKVQNIAEVTFPQAVLPALNLEEDA